MRRRDIVLAPGAFATLFAMNAHAQSPKAPRRIVFLSPSTEKFGRPLNEAFLASRNEPGPARRAAFAAHHPVGAGAREGGRLPGGE